ncbi:MAG: lytic transglycosylase domain-containing protein [Oscillospiraceae bacterium]|nr:lytic transglycosylase domain-containing protein [Oscillospiraceae bacterium]
MNNCGKQKRDNRREIGIIIALIAVVIFVISVVASCCANMKKTEIENPVTDATITEAPITEDPVTEPPITESPVTEAPVTEITTTEPIVTEDEPPNHDTPDLSDLEYPFDTISFDWSEETLDGWWHYDIPEDYELTGGYLPDSAQVYAYALCNQYDIDYPMVLALIEAESGYKYDAVSEGGALGYMQIVPRWHSEWLGGILSDDALLNPYLNIEVGVAYLSELSERFDSQDEVLTAYHYGVTGAYRDFWNNGETGSSYSDRVLEIAERIRQELYGIVE